MVMEAHPNTVTWAWFKATIRALCCGVFARCCCCWDGLWI